MNYVIEKTKKDDERDEKVNLFEKAIVSRGNIIMVFLALIIMVGAYFFIISPKVNAIIIETGSISALETETETLNAQLARYKQLEKEYNEVDNEKIEKVEKLMTVTPDLPNLFIQIESIAKEHNLKIGSVEANSEFVAQGKDDKNPGLNAVKLSFNTTGGSYGVLKKFLASLERNLRIFDVTSLSFPDKIDSFDIELSAYYIQ